MIANLAGFKQFVESDMDPSMEKKMGGGGGASGEGGKMDYFGGLGDEMGMEWQDIVTALEGEPWVSTHFSLGNEVNYKRSGWKIVKGSLNQNGADIVLKPQKGDRSYLPGNRLNKSEPDTKRYHLNRQQLIDFLTKGWSPAIQNAQGGGAAGGMGAPPGGAPAAGGLPPI